MIDQVGWHWIGRIRNRDRVRTVGEQEWVGAKTLYAKATSCAQMLGQYDYVRNRLLVCNLVLAKRCSKGRHRRSIYGNTVHSSRSLKHARVEHEPWLLAVCPGLNELPADVVVSMYAQRMQIEQAFRDLKNDRVGLGLTASHSRQSGRLAVLLLIACLACWVLRMIGEIARAHHLERQFQSNTRRLRAVLSVIALGLKLVRKRWISFSRNDWHAALTRLRKCADWAHI